MKPELIYVAAPYSAPTEAERLANVNRAIDAAEALVRLGHYPFVPNLSHYMDARFQRVGLDLPWDWWLEMDVRMLRAFDALFLVAPSPGANCERFAAVTLGIKVYRSLHDVPVTPF